MVRAFILSVLFVGLMASGAAAQATRASNNQPPQRPQGPFKWWQAEETKGQLGLTNDQSAKIEEIWQAAVPRLRSTFDDVDRYETQLSKLLSANETTEMDVIRQLNLVQVAKNEADRQRTLMIYRMYRVLSYEQRIKVKALRDRWEDERRGRRGDPPPKPPAPIKK